jgi:hypothetical protein
MEIFIWGSQNYPPEFPKEQKWVLVRNQTIFQLINYHALQGVVMGNDDSGL